MAREDHFKKQKYDFTTPLAEYVIEGYFIYWAKDWQYFVTAPFPYETRAQSMYLGCSVRYAILDNTTEEFDPQNRNVINIAYRAKQEVFTRYFGADWEEKERRLRD